MEYVIIHLCNWVKNNTAKKCSVMGIIRMIIWNPIATFVLLLLITGLLPVVSVEPFAAWGCQFHTEQGCPFWWSGQYQAPQEASPQTGYRAGTEIAVNRGQQVNTGKKRIRRHV